MSVRLTTPTGRPASSITGVAPKPRSVSRLTASRTVASRRIDTGLDDIKSLARNDANGRSGLLRMVEVCMAFFLVLVVIPSDRPNRRRNGLRDSSARETSADQTLSRLLFEESQTRCRSQESSYPRKTREKRRNSIGRSGGGNRGDVRVGTGLTICGTVPERSTLRPASAVVGVIRTASIRRRHCSASFRE